MQLLLHAPIPRVLWRLAAPNVMAAVLMTGVAFADAWYVGQLGTVPLASLALVFPFQSLMQMMAAGAIGGGITSAVARALGGGDHSQADSAAWHAVVIAVAMAAVYMVALGVFSRPIFALLGGSGEALTGAVLYAAIAFGGAPAMWLMFAFSAILRGTGDTATPARAVVAASGAQVLLSGSLTLGWGPFPAIGIAGPAAAMVICFGSAAVYLAFHLGRGKAGISLRPQPLQRKPAATIMQVGGLGLINSISIAVTVLVVTAFVGQYGTEALAGYGLGSRLELMLVPIAFGIGGALTAAVGVNFGARQYARARKIAWTGAGVTFAVSGVLGLSVAVTPALWLDRFTANPDAYAFGAAYLSIAGPFYGLFGAGQTLYFASQGTGRMLLPVSVGVVRFLTVGTAGLLAILMAWQVSAVFAAVAAGLAIVGIGLGLCLFGPGWHPRPRA